MKNTWDQLTRVLILSILLTGITGLPVHASRGAPGSQEFGIGARLSLEPENSDAAISLTAELQPDWLSIEVDWDNLSPEPGIDPDWSEFDTKINKLITSRTAVMLSLTNPPAWSLTAAGPDPAITADFISTLASRFGTAIDAVELFPAPNTSAGWGTSPNPADYFALFQTVKQKLNQQGTPLLLVSGGLETNLSADDPGAWSDVDYLTALYSHGANTAMPVIGLRFSSVNGLPSAYARKSQSNVLRHYEAVRKIMTVNGHVSGVLWITYLDFPSGTTPLEQTAWLAEAYPQIRTQLYIGVAFLQGINTCSGELPDCGEVSLISRTGMHHPFTPVLHGIIARNIPNVNIPGREKSNMFRKPR